MKKTFYGILILVFAAISCSKEGDGNGSDDPIGPQRLVTMEQYYYDDLVIEQRRKTEYSYADTAVSQHISYAYSNNAWVKYATTSIDYYSDSIVIRHGASENASDEEWNTTKDVFKTSDGHCIQIVGWYGSKISDKADYTYSGGDCTRYERFSYNSSSNKWVPVSKYEYQSSGGLVNSFVYYKYSNGAYAEIEKSVNTYSNGLLTEILVQTHENGTAWENFEKTVNTYSEDRIVKTDIYHWSSNNWNLYTSTELKYNDGGNVEEASTYVDIDDNPMLWYKYIYSYETGSGNLDYLFKICTIRP